MPDGTAFSYQNWLTRMFSAECVECGLCMCITVCPAGIDPVEELRNLQQEWELTAQQE